MTVIEIDLLKSARGILAEILVGALPKVNLVWDNYLNSDQPHLAKMVSFTVMVHTPSHGHTLAIVVKSQGHPRQLQEAINQLLRFSHKANRTDYLVIAAPYITKEGAALCLEEGIGYYDLSGNCRLAFGNYYVERSGKPNAFRKEPGPMLPHLYGPKSERVLRVLIGGREREWKVVPLAQEAQVSTGTVSIVRNVLLEREWAQETAAGLKITRPESLVKDWAVVWGRRRERPRTYFTLKTLTEIEAELAQFARQTARPLALTGTAGAWRRAPMTRYNRTQVYWEGDPAELANATGLKPAEAGANVQVFAPRDSGVFIGQEELDNVPVVSALQLFLDLQRDSARGEEAAEHLWQTQLFPADERAL